MTNKFQTSDIMIQLQQLDYQLLTELIKPIVVTFVGIGVVKKSTQNYKLSKDFDFDNSFIVKLPPNVIKKATDIDKEYLLKQALGKEIIAFATKLKKYFSDDDLSILYSNLSDIKVLFKNFYLKHIFFGNTMMAGYSTDNLMSLDKKYWKSSINHELFHAASTNLNTSSGILASGFCQKNSENKRFGYGINEGYTQLLTERYFFDNKNLGSYPYEKKVMGLVELIIGQDKMQSFYLNANLHGLIQELKTYSDVDSIFQFIHNVDFVYNHYEDNSFLTIKNHLLNEAFSYNIKFLINCYLNKIYSEENSIEHTIESIIDFLAKCSFKIESNKKDIFAISQKELINIVKFYYIKKKEEFFKKTR